MKTVRVDDAGRLIAEEPITKGDMVRIVLSRNAAPVKVQTGITTAAQASVVGAAGIADSTTPGSSSDDGAAQSGASSPALVRAQKAWGFVELLAGGCYGSPENPVAP